MSAQRVIATACFSLWLVCGPLAASELSFTFMDFEYVDNDVDASGSQMPVPGQTVSLSSDSGDGISVAGSLAIADRFFLSGRFSSAIVDVGGVVETPFVTTPVHGDYDLVRSNLSFGYRHEIGENVDLMMYGGYHTANFDFGSFAGENFDVDDSGLGLGAGVRWNPVPAFELHSSATYTPVGEANLTARELQSDTVLRTGIMWYFFQDLGLGVDYESGAIDAFTVSMRFSFGDLAW